MASVSRQKGKARKPVGRLRTIARDEVGVAPTRGGSSACVCDTLPAPHQPPPSFIFPKRSFGKKIL